MFAANWNFNWNWTEVCSTGLQPFAVDSNDLLPCFQEIVLQLPIYTLFAAVSAYEFGSFTQPVTRDATQLQLLSFRVLISIALALLPVFKIFVFHGNSLQLDAVDVLVVCTECIMWTVHSGYLIAVRRCGELSHRGPLTLNVMWLAVIVLDAVWLRTSLRYTWWNWSLASLVGDLFYALTLIPRGSAVVATTRYPANANREQEALLPPRYTYFQFDFNEAHLGHAQDEANWLSRFSFRWVEPLIAKGVAGGLKRIEDLFDLPDALQITYLSERLQVRLLQTRSLFRALHRAFGREFYLIGILRLIGDLAGFAGPLLLGGLLSTAPSVADENNVYNMKPYYYALGLFATTIVCM